MSRRLQNVIRTKYENVRRSIHYAVDTLILSTAVSSITDRIREFTVLTLENVHTSIVFINFELFALRIHFLFFLFVYGQHVFLK